jgi:hypothetical protein
MQSKLMSQMKYSRSTNATNRPVLPPIFPSAEPTPLTAPLKAGPAELVTLLRPSLAFDWNPFAVSVALDALSFAASAALDVVDSNLRAVRPGSLVVCRRAARDMLNDMMRGEAREDGKKRDRDEIRGGWRTIGVGS